MAWGVPDVNRRFRNMGLPKSAWRSGGSQIRNYEKPNDGLSYDYNPGRNMIRQAQRPYSRQYNNPDLWAGIDAMRQRDRDDMAFGASIYDQIGGISTKYQSQMQTQRGNADIALESTRGANQILNTREVASGQRAIANDANQTNLWLAAMQGDQAKMALDYEAAAGVENRRANAQNLAAELATRERLGMLDAASRLAMSSLNNQQFRYWGQ